MGAELLLEALGEVSGASRTKMRYRLARNLATRSKPRDLTVHGATLTVPLRPGSAKRGQAWLQGDFTLRGGQVQSSAHPYSIRPPSSDWLTALHGFDWMRHLLAIDQSDATRYCGRMMVQWTAPPVLRNPILWRADVTGRRLISWCMAWPHVSPFLSIEHRARIMESAGFQARWLARIAELAEDGTARLEAGLGLAHSALFLDDGAARLRPGIAMVSRELRRQFFADGGHLSRRPDILVGAGFDLIAIEAGLKARDIKPPAQLNESISRIISMVRLLRHKDGTMALFNGGVSLTREEIDPLFINKQYKSTTGSFAQKSGYQRIEMEKTCLIVDVGAPARACHSRYAHAAPLAFEMSHAKNRLIVNCGPNLVNGEEWHLASRGIAAHSTLAFDRNMADPFLRHGFIARVLGPRLALGKIDISSRRAEDKTGIWLEATHNLFAQTHGVRHNRRLYLDRSGDDLRGEDLLLPDRDKTPAIGEGFTLRFHLHPDVTCTRLAQAHALLLVQPGGVGWQFHLDSDGKTLLDIEDSVYMGETGRPVPSRQITIQAKLTESGDTIRWAFRQVKK